VQLRDALWRRARSPSCRSRTLVSTMRRRPAEALWSGAVWTPIGPRWRKDQPLRPEVARCGAALFVLQRIHHLRQSREERQRCAAGLRGAKERAPVRGFEQRRCRTCRRGAFRRMQRRGRAHMRRTPALQQARARPEPRPCP
jgi:hypothetical protein